MPICPMCKSDNITDDVKEEELYIEGLWKCLDCGYISNFGDF